MTYPTESALARFVAVALQEYRARRQQAGDSGKYSAQGLRELEQELTAEAAGIIRQALDDTHLRQNIAQTQAKLAPKAAADPLAELLGFWKKMEVSTQLDRLGPTVIDPATGTLSFDTVKGNLLNREARRSHNAFVMEALEEWPRIGGDTPVDPELIAQGQQQRARALDPLAAKALVEQEAVYEAMQAMLRDSLAEIPLPQPDPITEMAGKPTTTDAGDEG